jgi:hypothetical protein
MPTEMLCQVGLVDSGKCYANFMWSITTCSEMPFFYQVHTGSQDTNQENLLGDLYEFLDKVPMISRTETDTKWSETI